MTVEVVVVLLVYFVEGGDWVGVVWYYQCDGVCYRGKLLGVWGLMIGEDDAAMRRDHTRVR